MNIESDKERDERRRDRKESKYWKTKYENHVDKHDDVRLRECCKGHYQCSRCCKPAAFESESKSKREDAADLGDVCRACAEKDLKDEQHILIQNLVKQERKRLEQLSFNFRKHPVVELPHAREERLMKALKERRVEPGFHKKRDAAGFKGVCCCPGQACDCWGEDLRTWRKNADWPCPGPPHLDTDERINPHMAEFHYEFHNEFRKEWKEKRKAERGEIARKNGITLEQLAIREKEMTIGEKDDERGRVVKAKQGGQSSRPWKLSE